MSKDSSAKYYQDNKERLPKKTHERQQSLFKEEKENNNNMVVSDIKNFPEDKKQRLVCLTIKINSTK